MKTKKLFTAYLLTTALLAAACSDAVDGTTDKIATTGDTASNDVVAPCPSLAKFGEAYQNPCQLKLDLELEIIIKKQSFESDRPRFYQSESTLAASGELNQLYPPPFFLQENPAFLKFNGEVTSVGSGSGSPAYYREPRPPGWRESTYESQADYAGPVTLLLVEKFEPHPEDPASLCLTVGTEMSITGSGTTTSRLPDGTTSVKEKGPPIPWFSQPEGREEWVMGRATNATSSLPPSKTVVCEGAPPAGDHNRRLLGCSEGNCQAEFFGQLSSMTWYGLTANDEHTRWTFNGGASVSDPDIIRVTGSEYTWHLEIDLAIVPKTLEYD